MSKLMPSLPNVLPEASVNVTKSFRTESYYKCAFLSEADVARIYSVSAKSLKLKPVVLPLEDGTGTLTGFYVGLWGMPDHIRAAVRKVKISSMICVEHQDFLLSPSVQCRAEQAAATLQVALQNQVAARPTAERCSGRHGLHSHEALMEKGAAILEERGLFGLWQICFFSHTAAATQPHGHIGRGKYG